jgi:hypothetical protein
MEIRYFKLCYCLCHDINRKSFVRIKGKLKRNATLLVVLSET